MTVFDNGKPVTPPSGLSPSAGPGPMHPYHAIVDEHLPYGADTSHNLFPMDLHPTQKANGPYRPQRTVIKNTPMGNLKNLFSGFARLARSQPNPPVDGVG